MENPDSSSGVFRSKSFKSSILPTKQLLEILFRNITDLIAVLDEDNTPVWFNQSYLRTLGYDPDDPQQRPQIIVHPDDVGGLMEIREQCLATGKGQTAEYRVQSKNGRWIHLESRSQVVKDVPDIGTCLVITARDITKRKLRELEERETQRRMELQNDAFILLSRSEATSDGNWDFLKRRILQVGCQTLNCSQVRVWWTIDGDIQLTSSADDVFPQLEVLKEIEQPPRVLPLQKAHASQLRQKRLLTVADVHANEHTQAWAAPYFEQEGVRSVMQVPIYRERQIIGLISFEQKESLRSWKKDEGEFAISMGETLLMTLQEHERREAYTALEKSQARLAAELDQAAAYVLATLPPPLDDGPVEAKWRFMSSTWVGGDAFGYQWIDDNHFAYYLLDVCGHGVGAALLSNTAINVLRTGSLRGVDFKDPAAVLGGMANAFPMEEHNNMFFTLHYGIYEASRRKLTYASAGHPAPVILCRRNETTLDKIEPNEYGLVIGALAGSAYENDSLEIAPNSVLYLFSDGVFELRQSDGKTWTREGFVKTLQEAPAEADAALDAIVARGHEIQGTDKFEDDYSLLRLHLR